MAKINWSFFFEAAGSKAVGIFPPQVAEKIDSFPLELLSLIKWAENMRPAPDIFKRDTQKIIDEMLRA